MLQINNISPFVSNALEWHLLPHQQIPLVPPSTADRFRADDVLQDSREDCYLSTLHIQHTDEHDSRPYYLVVENDRGTDRHAIHLNVEGMFAGAEQLNLFFLFFNIYDILY